MEKPGLVSTCKVVYVAFQPTQQLHCFTALPPDFSRRRFKYNDT